MGLGLSVVVDAQTFLCDGEAAGSDGLNVILRQRGVQLLEKAGVEALAGDLGPEDLEGTCEELFLFAHHSLNLIFEGGDFLVQFGGHLLQFDQFADLGFHCVVRHCVYLAFIIWEREASDLIASVIASSGAP